MISVGGSSNRTMELPPTELLVCIDADLKHLMECDTANSNAAYCDFPTPMWVERDVFLENCVRNGLYLAIEHVLRNHKVQAPAKLYTMLVDVFEELEREVPIPELYPANKAKLLKALSPIAPQ